MSDQHCSEEPIIISCFTPPVDDAWGKIHPMTISQVLSEDNPLMMEGKNVAAISLVAHVTGVNINAARASFVLEDGTGKIYAEKDFINLIHQVGLEAEAVEVAQYMAFEHTYVEIMGLLKKNNFKRIQIKSIHPVHGYHQVMYHILNVIHSKILSQQCKQPYNLVQDFGSKENSVSHPILPSTFSPQRHQPYATLKPLEKAIMKYMNCYRDHLISTIELAQAIQASQGCTEVEFRLAFQVLLSEAYLTSPLDDGYVVVTPRH